MNTECGVYILYSQGTPVYVGSSLRISERIATHNHRGLFDSHARIPVSAKNRRRVEQEYIDRLKPTLNKVRARRAKELSVPTIFIKVSGDDVLLAERLRRKISKRQGKTSAIQVARLAYRALEREEAGK